MPFFGLVPPRIQYLEAEGDTQGLIKALRYWKAGVREDAARALWETKDPRVGELLVAALEDSHAQVSTYAAIGLALRYRKPGMREDTARAPWETKDPRVVVELLVAALEDSHVQVRTYAAIGLGIIKHLRTVEPLVRVLEDDDARVRICAARALGNIKGAADALGRIEGPLAVEPLVAALNDHQVCEVAARALKRLGWQPVNDVQRVVLAVAERHWKEVVGLAMTGLYQSMTRFSTQSSAAVEALAEALRDKNATTRQGAVEAIGEIGREGRRGRRHVPQAVDALVTALRDDNATVRLSAATALAEIGAPRAVDALVSALQDRHPQVRETAAELLKRLEWAPSDDRERALLAIVEDNWDEVLSCGTAALEPLNLLVRAREPCHLPSHVIASWGASGNPKVAGLIIASLAHPRIANLDPESAAVARTALWNIMLHTPSQIPSQDLLEIVTSYIPDTGHGLDLEGYPEWTEKVDLAEVRRLAREELVRRGVEVPESLSEDEHLRIRHAARWARPG
jgi:HEAT repeat protein